MAKSRQSKAQTTSADAEQQAPTQLAKIADLRIEDLNEQRAVDLCKRDHELAAKLIMALIAKNTAALPNTVFCKRNDLILKRVKRRVRITESGGGLTRVGMREVGPKQYEPVWDVTMAGWRALNETPGLQIIRPERVTVEGVPQMNPYIQVDPKSKMPEVVYARCLAVGYTPQGNLVASDAMIRLDIGIYLLENIQSKLHKIQSPEQRDAVARYGGDDQPPKDKDGKVITSFRFYPIHSVGGIGLWINLASPVLHEALKDHTSRLKFVERLAQSFAERNALKAHPGIPKSIDVVNGAATVDVYGWTTDFNRDDLDKLRTLVEMDRLADFRDHAGNDVTIQREMVATVTAEDVPVLNEEAADALRAEQSEMGGSKADREVEMAERKAAAEVDEALLAKSAEAFLKFSRAASSKKAKELQEECGFDNPEEATAEELEAFIDAVEQRLAT